MKLPQRTRTAGVAGCFMAHPERVALEMSL